MSGIDRRGEGIRDALAGEQPAAIPARLIGEEWASYLGIIPVCAPAVQVEECKRAFYAGAHAMYCATLAAAGHL